MDSVEIESVATPTLDDPVLVEGLPGVELVGKLSVDQLLEELDSEPVRRVYSEYFPPAVSVDDEGTASIASLTLYAIDTGERDLLVLTGNVQAQEGVGQYRVAETVLNLAAEFAVDEVVAIGGLTIGEQIEDYYVVGATPDGADDLRQQLGDAGVRFEDENTPDNIVGMSGVLVGLGARRGFTTAGLLGITPGYHVDPASARAVLEVLQSAFGFDVALDTLREQTEQVQQMLEQVRRLQQQQQESAGQGGENLRYFG